VRAGAGLRLLGVVATLTVSAGATLTVSACATVPASGPVEVAPSSSATAWDAELARATRRVEPYDWAMRQADLRATLITPRLRQAFAAERTRFHGRFARDTATELLAMGVVDEGVDATAIDRPKSEEQVLVFVAFYAADQKNRDLAIKGSIWDVALVRGQQRVKPVAIEPVRSSPAVVDVFPYVDRYDDLYLLRFPLVDAATGFTPLAAGPEPLHLEIASAIATCDVSWSLVDGAR
jgi:hypothetical protein